MSKIVMPEESQMLAMETSETRGDSTPHGSFMARLAPKFVRDVRETFKRDGLKGAVKRYGWKLFAAFFAYYLIRDTIIYLLVPYLIAKGFLG